MKVDRTDTEARAEGRRAPGRRRTDRPARQRRGAAAPRRPREPGGLLRPARPKTAPAPRPAERPARPKTSEQAKARSKARKAKAPRVVRPPLRERIRDRVLGRLEGVDLRPQALLARIPFVVLVIGSLGLGLGITLWLSTDSAQRSYQLASARELNNALTEQKEALERDVLQAESAPALADAARELGMIPSRDTAHLVQDPAGNWVVVGQPKPAAGAPPPPLNTKLPDPKPPAPPAPPPAPPRPRPPVPKPGANGEVPVRTAPPGVVGTPAAGAEIPVLLPSTAGPGAGHALGAGALPGPAGDTLADAAGGLVLLPLPTVTPVPAVTDVTGGVASAPAAPAPPAGAPQ